MSTRPRYYCFGLGVLTHNLCLSGPRQMQQQDAQQEGHHCPPEVYLLTKHQNLKNIFKGTTALYCDIILLFYRKIWWSRR